MASIKYGAITSEIKGNIGGTTFQGGRAGTIIKLSSGRTGKLTKADAGRMFVPKVVIAAVAGLWRGLSQEERDTWTTGAVNYPALNKFGEPYTPSGYQVFMTLNTQLYNLTGVTLTSCPAPESIPALPTFTFTCADPGALNVAWSGALPSGFIARISATQPMAGGNAPKDGFFKLVKDLAAGMSSPQEFSAAYNAVFGIIPDNAYIYFRIQFISNTTGKKGVIQQQQMLTNFP